VFKSIQNKALELYASLLSYNKDERGQTATEYTAVLVVAVGLAIGVLWLVLSGVLSDIISTIGTELSEFTDSVFA